MRSQLLGVALALMACSSPAAVGRELAPAAAATVPGGGPRLRANDGRVAALIVEGIKRSPRIRRLIDRIEQSDLIVYLETQPLLRSRVAGSFTWLTTTAQFRYARISINPEQFGEMAIAVLAHELQHAVEVANEPSVVSPATLEALYRRIGQPVAVHNGGWDTAAARDVGDSVRRELAEATGARITESIQPFDPGDWDVLYRQARDRAK